jgi:glycosyltransferase involved in cell wall biosynthesis
LAGPDDVGWRTQLEQQASTLGISDRITWTGMLSGDLKWGAFHASTAFALPSHQENFGIAVAEALSCSLPVVISNKVNIWREIESDNAGFVAADTLEGTCQLLAKLFACTPGQMTTLKNDALKCFKHRFDLNRGAESISNLFLESYLEK